MPEGTRTRKCHLPQRPTQARSESLEEMYIHPPRVHHLLGRRDPEMPEGIRNRAETEARNAAFGTLLALPGMLSVSSTRAVARPSSLVNVHTDAFALPTARRIADDRNFTEAVLGQMHPRMGAPEHEKTYVPAYSF